MIAQGFIGGVLGYAQRAHAATGVLVSVILAQWTDETAWGSSSAFVDGHNFAGVSPGGRIASYPSLEAGLEAYIATMNNGLYEPVKQAAPQGWRAESIALGRSPWAGGHYDLGRGPGSALVAIISDNELWAYDGAPPAQEPAPSGGDDVVLPTLTVGSSGRPVKSLQALLNARGASVPVDGSFGSTTRGAVVRFQSVLRIPSDGVVGPQAWGALLLV